MSDAPVEPPAPAAPPSAREVRALARQARRNAAKAEADARRAARDRDRAEKREMRRFTRRSRHRRAAWLTLGGIVVTLGVLLAVAVFSPLLALRTIVVEGTSRVPEETVRAVVEPQLGTPLALLDSEAITEGLAEHPLIRSYVTETVPPDTLVVHIVERQPIAVVERDGRFESVDPAGIVVQTDAERPAGMPLVEVSEVDVDSRPFRSVVEVLLALPDALLAQVDRIRANTRDDVTFTLHGSGQRVVWGSADESDKKALVLQHLVAQQGGAGAGEFDVSAPGTATFRPD